MKNAALTRYRIIDVIIFTAIVALAEYLLSFASNWQALANYTLSVVLAVSLIIMMRWDYLAVIPIVVGSAIFVLANHGSWQNYIIYIGGNLFVLINMLYFLMGKDKIKKLPYLLLYIISGYLLIAFGKSIACLLLLNLDFFSTLLSIMFGDIINLILALFIVIIMSKQKGVFEDQKAYLNSIKEEEYKQKYSLEDLK